MTVPVERVKAATRIYQMKCVPVTTLQIENSPRRASFLSKPRIDPVQGDAKARPDDGERPADETTSILVIKDIKSEARTRGLGTVVSMKQKYMTSEVDRVR